MNNVIKRGYSGRNSMKGQESYRRASYRNVQGEREEVQLVDLSDTHVESRLLARERHAELEIDILRTIRGFNRKQRLVLHRVLVQRYTLSGATCRMGESAQHWRRWYTKIALPLLRERLGEYFINNKIVV